MRHVFELVAIGPPVLSGRCSCHAWSTAWGEDELRHYPTFEPALNALVNAWAAHAIGAAERHLAQPDAAFYG